MYSHFITAALPHVALTFFSSTNRTHVAEAVTGLLQEPDVDGEALHCEI